MSGMPLRFVHASDFHLEAPPSGIAEVPAHLRDVLVDAPYDAARKVFDTVLSEDAEFLVLAGDILDAEQAGPRGVLFLAEQCQRLAEQNIAVYWIRGKVDPPQDWPSKSLLPENAHLLPRDRQIQLIHRRGETPRARLIAVGPGTETRDEASSDDNGDLFTIGLAYGAGTEAVPAGQTIAYWALGGEHGTRHMADSPIVVHYPGSPQGRRPDESGLHSCTLVEVESQHEVRTQPFVTDVLRWHTERLEIDATVDATNLEIQLRERLQRLMVDYAERHLLVSWLITGSGPLMGGLRRGELAGQLVAKLRTEFGHQSPAVWTVGVETAAEGRYPTSWYEEETMLGEFLRNVRRLQTRRQEPIDLSPALRGANSAIAAAVELDDSETRDIVLNRAACLGVDLLRGEDQPATTGKLRLG